MLQLYAVSHSGEFFVSFGCKGERSKHKMAQFNVSTLKFLSRNHLSAQLTVSQQFTCWDALTVVEPQKIKHLFTVRLS